MQTLLPRRLLLVFTSLALAISMHGSLFWAQPVSAQSPYDVVTIDSSTCSNIRGWAVDQQNPLRTIPLRIYFRLEGNTDYSYIDTVANRDIIRTPNGDITSPFPVGGYYYDIAVPDSAPSARTGDIIPVKGSGADKRTVYTVEADYNSPFPKRITDGDYLRESRGCLDDPLPGEDGTPIEGGTCVGCGGASFAPENNPLETEVVDVTTNPIYLRIVDIINFLSVGVGVVITASVVYAGIQYVSSRGDPNKTSLAVNRIWQAGIALFLFLFGWAFLNWIIPGGVLNPAWIGLFGV